MIFSETEQNEFQAYKLINEACLESHGRFVQLNQTRLQDNAGRPFIVSTARVLVGLDAKKGPFAVVETRSFGSRDSIAPRKSRYQGDPSDFKNFALNQHDEFVKELSDYLSSSDTK